TVPVADIERMARAVASSKLFGMTTPEQALSLMLVAQAEGRHPASAAQDYHIIQGRPAKKSDAMLRDFLSAGGKVQWLALDDKRAEATFSHPAGGTVTIAWDIDRAKRAALAGRDMWAKYPRQMLRSRVVSEGIRTVFPGATSGMYVPEEVPDMPEPRAAASEVRVIEQAPEPTMPDGDLQTLLDGISACKDEDAIKQAGTDARAVAKAAGDKAAYKRITDHTMFALDAVKVTA
ncbi:MAG: hypothetical protein ACK5X3_11775, partial [Pseudomonadota bacterium]